MSTLFLEAPTQNGLDPFRCFMDRFAYMHSLLQTEELAARLAALDELDGMICAFEPQSRAASSTCQMIARVNALKSRLESANEELFMAVRSEITMFGTSPALHHWLLRLAGDQRNRVPQPGLGFDLLDDVVNGILKLRDPGDVCPLQSPDMLPYQPTPARHILDLITAATISADDVLVDLGSGVGRVSSLVSILTGCRTLGVDLQPAYVACAQESVRNLKLTAAEFIATDARAADLSRGTAFYLFTPFTGSILRDVLERLLKLSQKRQIRVCSLGPCTNVLEHQEWLKPRAQPNTERVTVFDSQ